MDRQRSGYAPQQMNSHKRSSTAQACGEQVASRASTQLGRILFVPPRRPNDAPSPRDEERKQRKQEQVLRCFRWNGRNGVPQPPAHTAVAPPETSRRPSDPGIRGATGSLRGVPREGLVQGWRNRGPEAQQFGGAKLGPDRSPRHGGRVKGQSRSTAWRMILQASPATVPAKTARKR